MSAKTRFLEKLLQHPYFLYFTALFLFSSNGTVARQISLPSSEIVLLRSVIGSLLLVALFKLSGYSFSLRKYKRDTFFIVLSGIATAMNWLFLFEAYIELGVGLAILINYTGPVLVIALSPLFFAERLNARKIIALVLALAGVVLLSGRILVAGLNTWGLFCAAMSALGYAVMVLTDKMPEHILGMENATIQLASTALTVVVFNLLFGEITPHPQAGDWLPLLWLAVFNTGIACFCYFSAFGLLSAQSVAICGYLEPVGGALMAAFFLGETMTLTQLLGACLVIGGALYGELAGKEQCIRKLYQYVRG